MYDARESDEVLLTPGDSLYLPAGCVHSTCAQNEKEMSWAILFMFMEVGFADVVRDLLADAFADDPNWRHVPPLGTSTARATSAILAMPCTGCSA